MQVEHFIPAERCAQGSGEGAAIEAAGIIRFLVDILIFRRLIPIDAVIP